MRSAASVALPADTPTADQACAQSTLAQSARPICGRLAMNGAHRYAANSSASSRSGPATRRVIYCAASMTACSDGGSACALPDTFGLTTSTPCSFSSARPFALSRKFAKRAAPSRFGASERIVSV